MISIPPYNTTESYFDTPLVDGQSMKFGISNEDPSDKAWYLIRLKNSLTGEYYEK